MKRNRFKEPKGLIESIGKEPLYVYRGKTDYLLIYDKQSDIERLKPEFPSSLEG
jgi:hypothetical protein